ncbi:hypothetical protein P9112_012669 [Eukaryota sp. TZLM1-RC]
MTADLSKISSSGNFGAFHNKNPRLAKLVSSLVPKPTTNNRDDWVLLVAHSAIWTAGLELYGGFVRDYVLRNVSANDIDTLVPDGININAASNLLSQALGKYKIVCQPITQKGRAQCMAVSFPGGSGVEIDFTPASLKATSPFVDADINNFKVNKSGLVQKVKGAGGTLCNLDIAINHCLNQQFVFFYRIPSNTNAATDKEQFDMCFRRLRKMMSKGFTCISPLNSRITNQLSQYKALIKPDPKYDVPFHNLPLQFQSA